MFSVSAVTVATLTTMQFFIDAVSAEGSIVFWNDTACTLTGYRAHQICSIPDPWNLLYPDQRYRKELIVSASKQNWDICGDLWVITRRDGTPLPLLLSVFDVHTILKNKGAVKLAVGVHASSPETIVEIPKIELEREIKDSKNSFRFFDRSTPRQMSARQLSLTLRQRFIDLDKWLAE